MRLFVAIALTDDARAAIAAEQRRLASELGEAARQPRWLRPEQMHVTLAFIGDVAPTDQDVVRAIDGLVVNQRPFEMSLGGCGQFPSRGAPRVLWLGILDGVSELTAVRHDVVSRLRAVGIPFDTKPFQPHLTLARWRESRPSDARAVLRACDSRGRGPAVIVRMRVEELSLYDSQPARGAAAGPGPTYTPLTRVLLPC